jgi:hypothetical protein
MLHVAPGCPCAVTAAVAPGATVLPATMMLVGRGGAPPCVAAAAGGATRVEGPGPAGVEIAAAGGRAGGAGETG